VGIDTEGRVLRWEECNIPSAVIIMKWVFKREEVGVRSRKTWGEEGGLGAKVSIITRKKMSLRQ